MTYCDQAGFSTALGIHCDSPEMHFGQDMNAELAKTPPEAPRKTRIVVHVVAAGQAERALLARSVFSTGHHAEVYNDTSEFLQYHPQEGVVLIDEATSGGSAKLINDLNDAGLWLPIIGIGKDLSLDTVIAGTKAGVVDYFVGDIVTEVLVGKLEAAHRYGQANQSQRARKSVARQLINRLSAREREVVDFMARGLSNKAMARELAISPRTIEIHRMKMLSKLNTKTSAEAIRLRLLAFGEL